MARAVQKVAQRCEHATENGGVLDLSDCKLIQVPDAIYFLLRNIDMKTCNLSSNILKKLPTKFPSKFCSLTELYLSNNLLSTLPDEISELINLEMVDISVNQFTVLPTTLFMLQKLETINAKKNSIQGIDVDSLKSSPSLKRIYLDENPLSEECLQLIKGISNISITTSATNENT